MASPAWPRAQELPPGCHWISLAHILPLATVTDAPGCKAMTPVLSTTCACDTVNLPEFPIMYLFWVLTLCTETAAHSCFFYKNKKQNKKNHSGKRRHFILCTFWFFAMLACVLLREQGSLALGTCDPVVQPFQVQILLSVRRHCPAPPLSILDGHLEGRATRSPLVPRAPLEATHLCPAAALSSGLWAGCLSLGEAPWWPGVAHHPADSSISQRMFHTTPASQVTWSRNSLAVTRIWTHGHPLSRSSGLWTSLSSMWTA